jgi:glycolate oxidase FAD binding subunit
MRLLPETEAALAEAVRGAASAGTPLAVEGAGTKRAWLRPVQAAATLSTAALSGITLYRPQELILSARAGTPIAEIEAALAEKGQQLISEPYDLAALMGAAPSTPTLGGMVATNLSGPRRIAWGATRDHVMGVRAVNGSGEIFTSGGRVLKNVTGLDLCKLLSGSFGTLAVLSEITLKVLPAAESQATIVVETDDPAAGVAALSAGLGSPFGVSGAAYLPAGLLPRAASVLRIEDFAASVAYRAGALAAELKGQLMEEAQSRALWAAVRALAPLDAAPGQAVWKLSVAPSAAAGLLRSVQAAMDARWFLDWGGGLVWLAAEASEAAHATITRATTQARGAWQLVQAPDGMRAAIDVIPPEPPPLAAIGARVKAVMDPRGILNPGRMRAGL